MLPLLFLSWLLAPPHVSQPVSQPYRDGVEVFLPWLMKVLGT